MRLDATVSFASRTNVPTDAPTVTVRLVWDSTDPLIVTMEFVTGYDPDDPDSDETPTWVVGRELLSSGGGCTDLAGQIVVWRSAEWVGMALRSRVTPATFAVLDGLAYPLDVFLHRTYLYVPVGDEVTEQAVDAFIASCGVTP